MASVAGRKKSIVSTSGIQIDTPVANNTLLNKAASQSTSLYQQCSQLRIRLLRIKGFDYYFSLASSATDSRQSTDPVTHIWDLFTLGISLCYIADLLPAHQGFTKINNSTFDGEQYEANPDRAKKRAIAHFAMEIKRKIASAIPGCETFTVTDLWDRNSTDGLVKVVHTVTAIVNHLPPEAFEELPPSTPPLSAHDSMDSIPDSLPAQDAARQNIVREIVETERKYVQDLEVMQKYSNALYQNNIIDQDTIHLLFPNLNNLLNFQRKFLIRLESTAELPWTEQRWGQGFIDNEEEFVVYEPYCANYTNASDLMLAHEQSLAALNDLINVKGELPAFLIKPVQRVCKYPLLLDSLVKATSATTYPHFEELKKGSEAAKRIADRINEAQRRAENDQTVKNLQARVEDWKGHHIANFGELLLDDVFLVTKSDVDREYHVFLFEKIILCCKEVPPNAQNTNRKGSKSNSLLKKQNMPFPSAMGGPVPGQKKSTPLVLKGRIFLGNVTQAIPVVAKVTGASGVPTHYPLQVWWKGDDDLEFFTLRCRREDQMRQWDSQVNRLIKDLAQRKQMERSGLSRIAMPNGGATLSHVGSSSQLSSMQAQQTYPQMSTSHGRYSRTTYSSSVNSDAESISPSAIIGSYASSGPLGFSHQDAFEIDPDEDDLEDYPYTSSFASSGRGTPMTAGPRTALSDRDSMASYDANGHWRATQASSRPITPRLQSDPLGNLSLRGSRPQLRSQFSSTRLKSSYNDSGEYSPASQSQSQSQSPVPPHAQLSRSRSASQPTAYVPKHHLPPIPSSTQPQWSRDRPNTNMAGATTASSNKRGSGSSQSTGDSSDYSPNSSSPVTPYGSSDSSLGGVGLKTSRSQLFESVASGGMSGNNYHTAHDVSPVKVKIYFHEDVFIIEVPRHTEYERLVEKIGRKIRLCGPRRDDGPLRVKYRDEDGDMVSLGSTEDVQMAFSEYRHGGQVVLFVT